MVVKFILFKAVNIVKLDCKIDLEVKRGLVIAGGFRLSVNFCLVLYVYMAFKTYRCRISWSNGLIKDRDIYFVSQLNCRTDFATKFSICRRNDPDQRHGLNGLQKSIMLCRLFHCASFAQALIALAGDIELGIRYRARGATLKVGGLNSDSKWAG